jgi:hypothetical protein
VEEDANVTEAQQNVEALVRGDQQFEDSQHIKKKDFFLPQDDHPVMTKHLPYGLKHCEHGFALGDATIQPIFVYPYVSKTTVARVVRANPHVKFFSNCDYVLEISGSYWDRLSSEVRDILMHHECEHMVVKYDKAGNPHFTLRDHNIKDFRTVIDAHGLDWFDTITNIVSDEIDTEDDVVIKM